jgi:hypothetical protein
VPRLETTTLVHEQRRDPLGIVAVEAIGQAHEGALGSPAFDGQHLRDSGGNVHAGFWRPARLLQGAL